ncbi:mediator of RNA polymerase II transcription subunit 26-like [Rana temporaria]|uniref:mediator of RNA polymerase II transcription subunit 26-like n=1 Tax=Rana temporaria TaxID=8407 RepID=UPI001AAD1627|nr:mediator of RNA polymerase II transcription subunit 26-like [Rana temporaria]
MLRSDPRTEAITVAPVFLGEIKEKLLQAINPHCRIGDMVAVLEVISMLEKYPITTKEVLEETLLARLINDVRKNTSNKDLAKRAKKLLRSWQEVLEQAARGTANPQGSANGGSTHTCKIETNQTALFSRKPIQDLKGRNDIQEARSPKAEKVASRKRKGEFRDGTQGLAGKPNQELFQNSSSLTTNGIGGSPPENILGPLVGSSHTNRFATAENDKHGKIPVDAVRPPTTSSGLVKHSSTSSLLKVGVLQPHSVGLEATHPLQPQSLCARCSPYSPRGTRAELVAWQRTTYAPNMLRSDPRTEAMTAVPVSPWEIKERLLQAIDPQCNILNMVAVLEVISILEKYPITKEALEQTRLGKLINDLRKKTSNKDLARYARKLQRSWQKFIAPVEAAGEAMTALVSPRDIRARLLLAIDSHNNIRDMVAVWDVISMLETYPITIEVLEEMALGEILNEVRKKTSNEDLAKRTKKLLRSWKKVLEQAARGTANPQGSANLGSTHTCKIEKGRNESPTRDFAVSSPHRSVEQLVSTDYQLQQLPRVMQQHAPQGRRSGQPMQSLQYRALPVPVPLWSSLPSAEAMTALVSPRDIRARLLLAIDSHNNIRDMVAVWDVISMLEMYPITIEVLEEMLLGKILNEVRKKTSNEDLAKRTKKRLRSWKKVLEQAARGTANPQGSANLGSTHTCKIEKGRNESPTMGFAVSSPHRSVEQLVSTDYQLQQSPRVTQQHTPQGRHSGQPITDPQTPRSSYSPESSKMDSDDAASGSDRRKKNKSRSRGDQEGYSADGNSKQTRVKKDRKLKFYFMTGQIKPLANKEPPQAEILAPSEQHRTETDKQDPNLSPPSPFEQTDWKELSQMKIIQAECSKPEAGKTNVLVKLALPSELPGKSREVTSADLDRLHNQHWPGVNGCYDTQGNWFDWTQCISLDPHGDGERLIILPYVCLD